MHRFVNRRPRVAERRGSSWTTRRSDSASKFVKPGARFLRSHSKELRWVCPPGTPLRPPSPDGLTSARVAAQAPRLPFPTSKFGSFSPRQNSWRRFGTRNTAFFCTQLPLQARLARRSCEMVIQARVGHYRRRLGASINESQRRLIFSFFVSQSECHAERRHRKIHDPSRAARG